MREMKTTVIDDTKQPTRDMLRYFMGDMGVKTVCLDAGLLRWETPYGVHFEETDNETVYLYYYDRETCGLGPERRAFYRTGAKEATEAPLVDTGAEEDVVWGRVTGMDVLRLVAKARGQGGRRLFDKPADLLFMEAVMDTRFYLARGACLRWCCGKKGPVRFTYNQLGLSPTKECNVASFDIFMQEGHLDIAYSLLTPRVVHSTNGSGTAIFFDQRTKATFEFIERIGLLLPSHICNSCGKITAEELQRCACNAVYHCSVECRRTRDNHSKEECQFVTRMLTTREQPSRKALYEFCTRSPCKKTRDPRTLKPQKCEMHTLNGITFWRPPPSPNLGTPDEKAQRHYRYRIEQEQQPVIVGALTANDVCRVVIGLSELPLSRPIYAKPKSLVTLEKVTGAVAKLCAGLRWSLDVSLDVCITLNPFNLSGDNPPPVTSSRMPYNDILFCFRGDYYTVAGIINKLRTMDRIIAAKHCRCCGTVSPGVMLPCADCHAVYYCSVGCCDNDWHARHRAENCSQKKNVI